MLALLMCSAFFSGSETAFFNLSPTQLRSFRKSKHKLHILAASLLQEPKKLLTSILFGNMTVNVSFFALASVMSCNLAEHNPVIGTAMAVFVFIVLVLFGEMLPKSLAYSNSKTFAGIAAPACFLCVKILSPILKTFEFIIVEPAIRLLAGPQHPKKTPTHLTVNQLKLVIDSSRQQGLITDDENRILAEIVELSLLKVRHVMRARVDIVAANINDSTENIRKLIKKSHLTKIPLYSQNIDNIIGIIHLRDLLLNPADKTEKLLKKAHFVPEQMKIDSLIHFFTEKQTDTAVVVDEYGGIAGIIAIEDIFDEILGPLDHPGTLQPIEQLGPLKYRLDAKLPIHDWANIFGIDPQQTRLVTIGGFATTILGKIPKPGDVAYFKNIKLTVEKIQKNRIQTLILSLESISTENGA